MISYGDADLMLAGGVEACIMPISVAAFCKLVFTLFCMWSSRLLECSLRQ